MNALHPSEDAIQRAVISWCRMFHDGRQLTFHIPNEAKRSKAGYGIQAAKGTRAGASDLFVPMARGGWNGLFLELKAHGKEPTTAQFDFMRDMLEQGYCTLWCDTTEDAIAIIGSYATGERLRSNWVSYSHPVKA